MTPTEGSLFFVLEALYLPWQELPATLFVVFFWWLYAADYIWGTLDFVFFLLGSGFEKYEEESSIEYTHWQTKEEENATLSEIINKLWAKYDVNNSGELDKDEAMKFIQAVLEEDFK